MNSRTKIHLAQYLILLAILITGFYSILLLKENRTLQIISIILMLTAYVIWGISHHLVEKTFHIKIVVEYMLLAFTVATLLIILLSLG